MAEIDSLKSNIANITKVHGVRYLCHSTNLNPDNICAQGLFLEDEKLSKVVVEITQEFINNPIDGSLSVYDQFKKPYIILLGIKNEKLNNSTVKNYEKPLEWNGKEFPKYVLPSEYIIGYIDIDRLQFTLNLNYENINEFFFRR